MSILSVYLIRLSLSVYRYLSIVICLSLSVYLYKSAEQKRFLSDLVEDISGTLLNGVLKQLIFIIIKILGKNFPIGRLLITDK